MTADEIARMNAVLDAGLAPDRWKTETHRGPVELVFQDGARVVCLYDISSYDDWRDTPLGPVNFGKVKIGPMRHIVEYPDGREEPADAGIEGAIEVARFHDLQRYGKPRGFFSSMGKVLGFGDRDDG